MPSTIATLQRMLANNVSFHTKHFHKLLAPSIICADMTSLSVQASEAHFSIPRINKGPYTHVEVGYPSKKPDEAWRKYCERGFDTRPTATIYAYVPIEMVAAYIDQHGGFGSAELLIGFEDA